jgi:hypothetical protein
MGVRGRGISPSLLPHRGLKRAKEEVSLVKQEKMISFSLWLGWKENEKRRNLLL